MLLLLKAGASNRIRTDVPSMAHWNSNQTKLYLHMWSTVPDSNWEPRVYKALALPIAPTVHKKGSKRNNFPYLLINLAILLLYKTRIAKYK